MPDRPIADIIAEVREQVARFGASSRFHHDDIADLLAELDARQAEIEMLRKEKHEISTWFDALTECSEGYIAERDRLRAELAARPVLRVTEEAIEEAALAMLRAGEKLFGEEGQWPPNDPEDEAFGREIIRAALTAALPHLGAVLPSEEQIARAICGADGNCDCPAPCSWGDACRPAAKRILSLLSSAPTEAAIRAEEREACARIAWNGCLVPPDGGSPTEDDRLMCQRIAAAIRSRSLTGAAP